MRPIRDNGRAGAGRKKWGDTQVQSERKNGVELVFERILTGIARGLWDTPFFLVRLTRGSPAISRRQAQHTVIDVYWIKCALRAPEEVPTGIRAEGYGALFNSIDTRLRYCGVDYFSHTPGKSSLPATRRATQHGG